ncbi:flavin reductase family protein [Thermotalea metallivorans]|uniref:Flavoredoxin n=1 Tax=Thermotalea metallivorans TaxID=520762 RepID=A0A140L053_9FIRM|nr:flavin reductase family protein [Thermotalea metallivorans]KXG73928.1 Flavoredoxin [Thermotalea metallivorans]
MKRQLGQTDVFFPAPAALIVGGTIEEADVATIAWIGMLSSTPPIVGVSFDNRRYTLELIRRTREFTVNIPSADHYKETDFCGLISGRDTNKFIKAGLTPIAASRIKTPIIRECPFNLECKIVQEFQLGDYLLIMGEIVETHIDEDKVNFVNNRPQIDISKINPLVYCATVREYWSLGKKLGNAFQSGMDLLNQ